MLIALHRGTTNNEKYYAEIWAKILEAQGVDVRWVDLTAHDPFEQIKGCDGVVWHHGCSLDDKLKANRILHSIELYLGIPVYPDHYISWHFDEKIAVHYVLKAADVPTPPTWVFWNKEEALEWANLTNYPKVFKLSPGSRGKNVVKVDSSKEARRLIELMFGIGIHSGSLHKRQVSGIFRLKRPIARFRERIRHALTGKPVGLSRSKRGVLEKGYAYFQEFIPHDFETRTWVVGDQIWANRKFPLPGDFRVSGGPRIADLDPSQIDLRLDPSQIDLRCVRTAKDICDRLGFSAMAIDFLFHNGDPVVIDIGYTIYTDSADLPYPGFWNKNLVWTEGVQSHKEADVKTFLEKVRSGKRPQVTA